MLEKRFRIWDKNYRKMANDFKMTAKGKVFGPGGTIMYEDSFILMQSVGQNDIHNNKIFEGDIVRTKGGVVRMVFYNEREGGFRLYGKGSPLRAYKLEIIGNCFENEDLLTNKDYERTTRIY